MTKIGIMSMQRIFNYGSSLQAYGLRRLLEASSTDVRVSFEDFRPGPPLVDAPRGGGSAPLTRALAKVREVRRVDARLVDQLRFVEHKRRYGARYFPDLGIDSRPRQQLDQLDLQVIGSDEVFNCVQANPRVGYARDLFGHGSAARSVVSYAASFGNTTMEKIDRFGIRHELAEDLGRFDEVSVRDENSAGIVAELTGRRPAVHVDPVLAYDYMSLEPRVPGHRMHARPYVVVYGYSGRLSPQENAQLREYARQSGADILCFGGIQECADRFVECSPFELLAYFRDAEAVVTDTFHGTIFSLINHRPFATIVRPSVAHAYGNEEKLMFLLERFGVASRRVHDMADVADILSQQVDRPGLDQLLAAERRRTADYLRRVTTLPGGG